MSNPSRITEQVRGNVRRPDFLSRDHSYDKHRPLVALRQRKTAASERPVERPEPIIHNENRPQSPQLTIAKENSHSTEPPLLEKTQAVLGPFLKRDITIHLQLDIEEDLEGPLEEFSRLKRLGNFRGAEEYFQNHLQAFIDIPAVSIELADMLLLQGAYKRLKQLRQELKLKPPLGPADSSAQEPNFQKIGDNVRKFDDDSDSDSSLKVPLYDEEIDSVKESDITMDRFDITFHLIEATSYMISQGWLNRALVTAAMKTGRDLAPNSTSMHNILLSIEILAHINDESNFAEGYPYSNIIENYSVIYKHLVEQGRIWEARDLISACIQAFGAQHAWRMVLDADLHSPEFFTGFLKDWKAKRYDPSTYLAILDVLVALGQYLILSTVLSSKKMNIATAKRCLEKARDFAALIKENDPEYIKSRPYIRWIIVQEELSRKLGQQEEGRKSYRSALSFQHLQKFPGITMWKSSLPIYAPAEAENPGSHVSHFPESDNELLHIALQASEELGDYRTQVLCLRELICRTKDPKQLFDKLTHLQRFVQGDMIGYLQTCISRYLYSITNVSRQALIDELAGFDGQQAMSYRINNPLILWQQRKVQSALYLSVGLTSEAANAQDMAKEYQKDLPSHVQSAISKLWLSSNWNHEAENNILEQEIFYDRGRKWEQERERDRDNTKPSFASIATADLGSSSRNMLLSRLRSQSRDRQRIRVKRQSSLDNLDREPLTREVEGIYGRPMTIVDPIEIQQVYMSGARAKTEREREHPTMEKQPTNISNGKRDSEMIIEEIRRDYPPPGTSLARPRAVWGTSALSDSKEDVEMSGETNAQWNILDDSLLERIDGEIEDDYKQRIEKYVLLYDDMQGQLGRVVTQAKGEYQRIQKYLPQYETMQEHLSQAITQAKSKLNQMNKTHVSWKQRSMNGRGGETLKEIVSRDRPLDRVPREILREENIETREGLRKGNLSPKRSSSPVPIPIVVEIERSPPLIRIPERSTSPSIPFISEREKSLPMDCTPISKNSTSPPPIPFVSKGEGNPPSVYIPEGIIEREGSFSRQEKLHLKEFVGEVNTRRYEDEEHKGDMEGNETPQVSDSTAASPENDQKAQKEDGGETDAASAESSVTEEREELREVGEPYSVEELDNESVEAEAHKRGKTKIPAQFVNKQAIENLGYPFSEEGKMIVVHIALGPDSIDELIKLSEKYKGNVNAKNEGDKVDGIEEGKQKVVHPSPRSFSKAAANEDNILQGLKRSKTFPTLVEVLDDGKS